MVRIINAHDVVTGKIRYYEFAGLSTDEKPTEKVCTGSRFLEVDTGDTYVYDEENEEWNEISSGGGGGGGGGDDDAELVNVGCNYDAQHSVYTLEKTAAEILAYIDQGKVPYYDVSESETSRTISRLSMHAIEGDMKGFMFTVSMNEAPLVFYYDELQDYPTTVQDV